MQLNESQERYWQKNLNITAILLAIWFVVTFVVAYFARDLSFTFFGWPFSFWVGAQGALAVYVLIIVFYAIFSVLGCYCI
ncbi:MAG: DUF4212 domain-containing protein [Betaproteobacteria bacterium]|nr:DUF4212 domain-containing protein [Betaproteobacteria bacterium]